jgi:hypothetical protein
VAAFFRRPRWQARQADGRGRFFEAARSAADQSEPLWLTEPIKDDPPSGRLRTQRRWVEKGARLLALVVEVAPRTAEVAARHLGVAGTWHERARKAWAEARDIRARSAVIVGILALIPLDAGVTARLLGAGSMTGATGRASIWDPETSRLLFPSDGTAWSGSGRSRPPPSFEIGSP